MSIDRNYYYDFEAETKIEDWHAHQQPDDCFLLETSFQVPANDHYVLLFAPRHPHAKWRILSLNVSGRLYPAHVSSIAYVHPKASAGFRYGFEVELPAGRHSLQLQVYAAIDDPEAGFAATWIKNATLSPVKEQSKADPLCASPLTFSLKPERDDQTVMPQPDLGPGTDFLPGVGTASMPSAGRFGYTKGNGVLDCAMPLLGVIDKMYLCGHPRYKKPYKWTYSILPYGIDPTRAYHGSRMPAQAGIENDEIKINHLSVQWRASFTAVSDFFERQTGTQIDFKCTYSLASPGILAETSDPGISLSMLEYAGNYQYLIVPAADGIQCRPLAGELDLKGVMTENWLLVCGAAEFPDIPILLVFTKAPDKVRARTDKLARLTALDIHIPRTDDATRLFVATPFGIESFACFADILRDSRKLGDLIRRCRFWSRAFLMYPIACEEHFKLTEAAEKVQIVQQFQYRELSDQWHTSPLKTAPLPPMLTLLEDMGIVEFSDAVIDFNFPSKYGYLKGAAGHAWSSYTIPYMPRSRCFPLRDDVSGENIAALLADGMDEYFAFQEQFSDNIQAYPYAGSSLEPYAWSAPMFNFLDEQYRALLVKKLAQRTAYACSPERRYCYPAISWQALMSEMPEQERVLEIYRDPEIKHLNLYNWYWRREPFTGLSYRICYMNVGLFRNGRIKTGTREEVAAFDEPLIENDWGAGLAFYYIYLAAQISGDFSAVRQNWGLLQAGFDYFAKLHDWACMSTAYSENGITWVEGANYGAFTAFVNLAEALEEQSSYAKGVYLAAKQIMLRLSKFRFTQTYLHKYFEHPPWFTIKSIPEETSPHLMFLNVPKLWRGKYRASSIYNLTTEGMYPEIFMALMHFLPAEFTFVRDLALESYAQGLEVLGWGAMQESSSCLMAQALDDKVDTGRLLKEIGRVEKRGNLIKKWRGIHIFSRCLPENYFKSQLLAWQASKTHPVWMEFWVDIEIQSAKWSAEEHTATIKFNTQKTGARMRFGLRRSPKTIKINRNNLDGWRVEKSTLTLTLNAGGTLEMIF